MPVGTSTLAADTAKFISDKLIARSTLLMRLVQMGDPVPLPDGSATTANFIKYNRTDVALDVLTEGVTPAETPFTVATQSVTLNQWGLYITLTDVGLVTTKHPVLNEAIKLVSDAISRTQEYGFAEVLNAGTNVQFWDGTRANRAAITSTDVFKKEVFNKARVDLNDNGAPTRDGDFFVIVCGSQVEGDILNEASAVGSFLAAHQLQNTDKLEKGVVGAWLGFKIMRGNFLPKFTRLTAVTGTAGTSGSMATATYFYKVTRRNTQRGFEEDITVEGSVAVTGATGSISFTPPATAGYVYNIYVGATTGDANLFLAAKSVLPGVTTVITSVVGSGVNPPATPPAGVTVHPMYVFGAESVNWVPLDSMSMKSMMTPPGSTDSDPLQQRRKVGAKYMAKAMIRDNTRFKRIELASTF